MKTYRGIRYSHASDYNTLCLMLPDEECKAVFVYIHGGGLEVQKPCDNIHVFMPHLCEMGIGVATVDYRCFPEHRYPDFLVDSACAVAWVKKHIKEYTDCDKIYVGGSSAGGYISMMLCFDKRYLGMHNMSAMDIDGFIHDAGQPTAHFNVLKSHGFDSRKVIIDETAPLYYIGDDTVHPPMLFLVSDNDMKNRYEQTMLVMKTLEHFEYDMSKIELKVLHGGHCHYINDDENDRTFAKLVAEFIDKN